MRYIVFLFSILNAYSLVELSGAASFERQKYGDTDQNTVRTDTYDASIAVYLFTLTGIEFNYHYSEETITQNESVDLGSGLFVDSTQNIVIEEVIGVGIRQAFGSRKALILPVLSIGYAKQINKSSTKYLLDNNGTKSEATYSGNKNKSNATFGAFTLRINLSQRFSVDGTVKTVFPNFDYKEAENNIKYMFGFTLYI